MAVERIPLNTLQTAVYGILSVDTTLQALGVTVCDWMTQSQPMPAVTIGTYNQEGENTKRYAVTFVTMEIDCYSNTGGFKEVNQIMDAVVQALTPASALSLADGYQATNGMLVSAQGFPDIDLEGNLFRHGVVQIGWHIAYTG